MKTANDKIGRERILISEYPKIITFKITVESLLKIDIMQLLANSHLHNISHRFLKDMII